MDLSKAKSILEDKNSPEEERKLARQEMIRSGYFQRLNPDLVPEKMFIKIKANPNILWIRGGEPVILNEVLWINLLFVKNIEHISFARRHYNDFTMLFYHAEGLSFNYEEGPDLKLYFVESSTNNLENDRENNPNRDDEQESMRGLIELLERDGVTFESGLEVYKKLLETLNSHTTEI